MEPIEYEIVRSRRRTLSIEIKPGGRVIVRSPLGTDIQKIETFVASHESWIKKHLVKQEKAREQIPGDKLTEPELKALVKKAKQIFPLRVQYYADKMGVSYGKISIRKQTTRWGSCTREGNLSFNCLLCLTPLEVLDSVVVHELCHRKQMNHSKAFYDWVYKVYPDYKKWDKWLKDNGDAIIKRMTG